nr:hypothetical protein [Pandoravirus massiliensis]
MHATSRNVGHRRAYDQGDNDASDDDVEAQDTPCASAPSSWTITVRRFLTLASVVSGAWCINVVALGEPWPRATTVCCDLMWLAVWSLWEHRRASRRLAPTSPLLRRRRSATSGRDPSACRLA